MNYDKAYRQGFESRCRELGVDPDYATKQAQYAGGLGGAAIGGVIGAFRGPEGRRYKARERLKNILKGLLVGGGIGALGEFGLRKAVAPGRAAHADFAARSTARQTALRDKKPYAVEALKNQLKMRQADFDSNPLYALDTALKSRSDALVGKARALPGQMKALPGILGGKLQNAQMERALGAIDKSQEQTYLGGYPEE